MSKGGKILKAMLFCIVFAIIAFFGVQVYIHSLARPYIKTSPDELPAAEAVIVLGARVYSDGTPSPVLRDRLDYGIALYRAGKASKIIASGDHGSKGYDEVNAMKQYLLDNGIPRSDIFLDHAGFDTYDSMYRARSIFGVKTIIISTQSFHIYRSVYIARRLGMEAYGFPCADKPEYGMNYLTVRELAAKAKSFVDVEIFRRKPKFLGEVIPINGDGTLTDG